MKAWTRKKAKSRQTRQSRQTRRGGMHRLAYRAVKSAAKEVFTGKNPVETADKVKQVAEAIIKGTTSQAGDIHRVTPQRNRTFSFSLSGSSPINYSTNSPITPKYGEFQPQTPVKSKPLDTEEHLLPKLPRHRSSMQTPLSYAPTLHDSTNVIRRNLFD